MGVGKLPIYSIEVCFNLFLSIVFDYESAASGIVFLFGLLILWQQACLLEQQAHLLIKLIFRDLAALLENGRP